MHKVELNRISAALLGLGLAAGSITAPQALAQKSAFQHLIANQQIHL